MKRPHFVICLTGSNHRYVIFASPGAEGGSVLELVQEIPKCRNQHILDHMFYLCYNVRVVWWMAILGTSKQKEINDASS